MKNRTRGLLIFVVVIAVAIASTFAFLHWQASSAREAMKPHARLASLYATRMLELQLQPASITFGEYFKKADAAIDEVEKSIMSLRAASTADEPSRDQLVSYMTETQQAIRELIHLNRLEMDSNSLRRQFESLEVEYRNASSPYLRESVSNQQLKIAHERLDKLAEMRNGLTSVNKSVLAVDARQAWLESTFGVDAIVAANLMTEAKKHFAVDTEK